MTPVEDKSCKFSSLDAPEHFSLLATEEEHFADIFNRSFAQASQTRCFICALSADLALGMSADTMLEITHFLMIFPYTFLTRRKAQSQIPLCVLIQREVYRT